MENQTKLPETIDYLSEWLYLASAATDGFAQWQYYFNQYYVGWQLDDARRLLRQIKQAHWEQREKALIYHAEGQLHAQLGEMQEAVDRLKRAIYLLEESEYVAEGIEMLIDVGMYLRIQDDQKRAKAVHEQALALAQEIEREDLEAEALAQIGLNLEHQKQYAEAITYFERSLSIWQQWEDQEEVVRLKNHLGNAYRMVEQFATAQQTLEDALSLAASVAVNEQLRGQIEGNLGAVYFRLDNWEEAERHWTLAIDIFDQLDARFDKIGMINNLGGLIFKRGDKELATEYFGRSFALAEEIGDRLGMETALTNLAIVLGYDPTEDEQESTDGAAIDLEHTSCLH